MPPSPDAAAPTATRLAELPADVSAPLVERTVGGLLLDRAAEHPERLALIGTRHGSGTAARLTYAQLRDEACRVATALSALAAPGEPVALWAPNVIEWPIIEYGAALAGVILVALNPVLRGPELEYVLRHSRSTVLLHADTSRDYDMAAVATQMGETFPDLRVISLSDVARWCAETVHEAIVAAAPTDPGLPVMLQYTSGTTGRPKGVLLRHRSLVNVARLTLEYVGVAAGSVCVNPLPMFHTASCVIGTLGPLWIGGTEILIEQFVPATVLDAMRRESASVLFYVPAVLAALLEVQRSSDAPAPVLSTVMGGAANVAPSLIEAAEQVFGASVINLFGQTELAPVLTATRPGDSRADQLGTVGHPLPHVDVKIVDPATGDTTRIGEPGEICARGYQQMITYLHDPEATAATVDAEGYVHTGDLGAMDERGYIQLTGRLKELIIRKGENIAPAEIESCLVEHEAVLDAAVFGIPDDRSGEIVGAAVASAASSPPTSGRRWRRTAAPDSPRSSAPRGGSSSTNSPSPPRRRCRSSGSPSRRPPERWRSCRDRARQTAAPTGRNSDGTWQPTFLGVNAADTRTTRTAVGGTSADRHAVELDHGARVRYSATQSVQPRVSPRRSSETVMRMNTGIVGNLVAGLIAFAIYAVIAFATGASAGNALGVGAIVGLGTLLVSFVITRLIVASRKTG